MQPGAQGAITIDPQNDAVRDVKFSPFYWHYFAAAYDNGFIEVLFHCLDFLHNTDMGFA